MIEILTVPCLQDNLCYLIADSAAGRAIAIDASEAAPILTAARARDLRLEAVLLTHHHPDHTLGLAQLPAVPSWTSARDQARIPLAGGNGPRMVFDDAKPLTWSEFLGRKADATDAPALRFRSLAIPGHTEGQIAILLEGLPEPHAFVGDTLFSYGCGRCLEGSIDELFASLQRLKTLDPATRLHFGHEYSARNFSFWQTQVPALVADQTPPQTPRSAPRLAEELLLNPFLQIDSIDEFRRLRLLRDRW